MEVISLSGVLAISEMEEKPKNWKALLVRYLDCKWNAVKSKNLRGKDAFDDEMDFLRALRISKRLGVVYGRLGD
jgi:hypothetical protein